MSINSKEIEERVVSMKFDNEDFEKRTRQTMSTLDKLKASLDFRGVSKGFTDVSQNASILSKNIDVLGGGVASIQREFSSLEVIGATCLVNLTNAAIRAGKTIVNALTIQPVTTGFQEYETKMGSIQTILTNTAKDGTTLKDVTEVIDELNEYADKTIYNFSQMTRNIGTFTAAGIQLKPAADAIQGIANLAAASGSTSQQASTAMYQLSQALAAGSLKLQDWNSVVNAGMGGTLFQDALKETAREYGIDVDAIIEKQGSFRNSLQEGWITADVLTTTLNKFTKKGAKEYGEQMLKNAEYTQDQVDALEKQAEMMENAATEVKTFTALWDTLKETAQSGWGKTWELIVGDYEEAKEFFTRINNIISPFIDRMSNARNDFLEKVLGSPSKWDAIVERFNSVGIGMDSIRSGMAETFQKRGLIQNVEEFDKMLEQAGGDYTKLLRENSDKLSWVGVKEGLQRAIRDNANYTESTLSATEKLEKFQKVVSEVWRGDYGNQDPDQRAKALEKEGWEYERVQRLVNLVAEAKDGYALTMEDLSEEDLKSLGLTREEIEAFQQLQAEIRDSESTLNDWIKSVQKETGRKLLIDSLFNLGKAMKSVIEPIAMAFNEVFTKIDADDVYGLIEGFNALTKRMVLNKDQMENVKNVFLALFNVIDTVKTVLSTGFRLAISVVTRLLSAMHIDASKLFAGLAKGTTTIREFVKQNDLVGIVMTKIGPIIDKVGGFIGTFVDKIKETNLFEGGFTNTIKNAFEAAIATVKYYFRKLLGLFGINTESIENEMEGVDISNAIQNSFNGVISGKNPVLNGISTLIGDVDEKDIETSVVVPFTEKVKNAFILVLTGLKTKLGEVVEWVKTNIDPGAIISAVVLTSMGVMANRFAKILEAFAAPAEALGKMFESIGGVFDSAKKYVDARTTALRAKNFLTIATAILVLVIAIKKLSEVNTVDLAIGLAAITYIMVLIDISINVMGKALKKVKKSSLGDAMGALLGFATLLWAMGSVMKKVGEMELGDAAQGFTIMTFAMAEMLIFVTLLRRFTRSIRGVDLGTLGTVIIAIGLTSYRFVKTIEKAGKLSKGVVQRGTAVLFSIITALSVLTLAITHSRNNLSGAAGLGITFVGIAIALDLIIRLVEKTSEISMDEAMHSIKIMGLFSLLIVAYGVVSRLAGKGKGGAAILSMVFSLSLIPLIIKEINVLNLKDVNDALKIIGVISACFALIIAASGFANENSGKAASLMVMATILTAAFVAIVWAFGQLKPESIIKGELAVAGLIAMMSVLVAASSKAGDAKATLIALGASILAMGGALIVLSILPWQKTFNGLVAVGTLIGMMALVLKYAAGITKENSSIAGIITVFAGMLTLIMAVAGLITVMAVLDGLGLFGMGGLNDRFIKMAAGIAMLTIAIGATMALIFKSMPDKINLSEMGKVALCMIGLEILVGITSAVIALMSKYMSDVDISDVLDKIALAIGITAVMVIMVSAISAIANKSTAEIGAQQQLMLMMTELAHIMFIVAAILTGIQHLLPMNAISTDFMQQLGVIIFVMAAMAVVSGIIAGIANESEAEIGAQQSLVLMLTELVVIMLVAAGVVKAINALKISAIPIETLGSLATVMIICSVIAFLIALIAKHVSTGIGDQQKIILMFTEISVLASYVAATVMQSLGQITNTDGFIEKAVALGLILIACGAVAALLSGVVNMVNLDDADGVIVEGGLLFTIAVLADYVSGTVMKNLSAINGDQILSKTAALCVLILAFGLIGLLCNVVGSAAVTNPIATFVGILTTGAIAALLGAIANLTLNKAAENAEKLGNAFGPLGEGLTKFSESMADFDDTRITKAQKLLDIFNNLNSIELTNLTTGLDEGTINLLSILKNIAEAVNAFVKSDEAAALNQDNVDRITNCLMPIIELTKALPRTGGEVQDVIGDKDLLQFTASLRSIAINTNAALEEINKHTDTWFEGALNIVPFARCITPLIEVAKLLPRTGGELQDFIGTKDLLQFCVVLPNIAIALRNACGQLGVGSAASNVWIQAVPVFDAFAKCISSMATAAQDIPNTGGFIAWWVGDNTVDVFATQLATASKFFRDFFDTIGDCGWDLTSLNLFEGYLMAVTSFLEHWPGDESIAKMYAIESTIMTYENEGELFTRIRHFGQWLTAFSDSVGGVNFGNVTMATLCLSQLVNSLSATSGVNFSGIENFSTTMTTLGETSLTNFSDQFENSWSTVKEAVDRFTSRLIVVIWANWYEISVELGKIRKEMVKGIDDMKTEVSNACGRVVDAMTSNLSDSRSKFYTIGKNLMIGLMNGMEDQKNSVTGAAEQAASFIGPVMMKTLDEKSPSKLTEKIGAYATEGLANGILKMAYSVENSSQTVAQMAADELTNSVYNTINSFDDETFNPTIRPVVDMSNVYDNFGSINSMLNGYTIGARAMLQTDIYRGATNDDLLTAMGTLNESISGIQANNYTVNGITYDDGSNVSDAVNQLIYAAQIARRV